MNSLALKNGPTGLLPPLTLEIKAPFSLLSVVFIVCSRFLFHRLQLSHQEESMTLFDTAVWQYYALPPSPCQHPEASCLSGTSPGSLEMAQVCEHLTISDHIYKTRISWHLNSMIINRVWETFILDDLWFLNGKKSRLNRSGLTITVFFKPLCWFKWSTYRFGFL